jgi:hypothetical protein
LAVTLWLRPRTTISAIEKQIVDTRDVRYWPKADIASCTAHVRFRSKSGHFWHQSGHQVRRVANCGFMSAFGGKADMAFCGANVCFWPKADIKRFNRGINSVSAQHPSPAC